MDNRAKHFPAALSPELQWVFQGCLSAVRRLPKSILFGHLAGSLGNACNHTFLILACRLYPNPWPGLVMNSFLYISSPTS